jgi:hypothetical protein
MMEGEVFKKTLNDCPNVASNLGGVETHSHELECMTVELIEQDNRPAFLSFVSVSFLHEGG